MGEFDQLVRELDQRYGARARAAAVTPMAKSHTAAARPFQDIYPSRSLERVAHRAKGRDAVCDPAAVAADASILLKAMVDDRLSDPAVRTSIRLGIGTTLKKADEALHHGRLTADQSAEIWQRGQMARRHLDAIDRRATTARAA